MYISIASDLTALPVGVSTTDIVITGAEFVGLIGLAIIANVGIIFVCGQIGLPLLERAVSYKQS